MSKIQTFESKSQQTISQRASRDNCSRCQRYKLLKANHNYLIAVLIFYLTVHDVKDTNF